MKRQTRKSSKPASSKRASHEQRAGKPSKKHVKKPSTRRPPRRRPKGRPREALAKLLSMSLENRVAAVAKDVKSRRDEYAGVDPFDLARALDVPEPESPNGEWSFTTYAEIMTVEEAAEVILPASEFVYRLQGRVAPERFDELVRESAHLDEVERPSFDFLTAPERAALEDAIARERLEANLSNGMCCVALYSLPRGPGELRFEAGVEDDGSCIHLRTPYDDRDGHFTDLSECVTDSW